MTSTDPKQSAGYRGTLPAKEDRLARPWLIIVSAILVGIFVLALLGIPSRFVPDATPMPVPTVAPTAPPADEPSPTGE